SGQDRAGSDGRAAPGGLDDVRAPPDLARPPRLSRTRTVLQRVPVAAAVPDGEGSRRDPEARVKPVLAIGAIVWDDDRLLVVKRGAPPSEGLWTVPGGKLEFGEKLEAAVVREVREETGLVVECGGLAAVVERSGEDWHYVILDYLATLRGGTLRAGDDVTDAR